MSELIKLTKNGIKVASYTEIVNSLIDSYKEIYGSDIDTSTGTADGIMIHQRALLINNMLSSIQELYSNLDITTATGQYLTNLCSLSGIFRKSATASSTYVEVTNNSLGDTVVVLNSDTKFVDKNGLTWSIVFNEQASSYTIEPNKTKVVLVVCDTVGKIVALAGSISSMISDEVNDVTVVQPRDAITGEDEETDAALRNRKLSTTGNMAITVLDSLIGQLLQIPEMYDVKIYNAANNSITAKDGTVIPWHNVYVILAKNPNFVLDKSMIGSIIYENMTPGISTTQTIIEDENENKSYEYKVYSLGTQIETNFNQIVYWRETTIVQPLITITLDIFDNYDSSSDGQTYATANYVQTGTSYQIVDNAIKYLNGLQISEDINQYELRNAVDYSDKLFKNRRTFVINNIVISDAINKDVFYRYTKWTVGTITDSKLTITLGEE